MKIQLEKMKIRDKPNVRRRTIAQQFKEIDTMHRHSERNPQQQRQQQQHSIRNAMIHLHSMHSVYVIAATMAFLLLCFQPAIVNCDNNNNVLNEIDNGGEVHAKSTLTELTGGRVIGEKWLRQMESPYSLEMDLTIERSGKLFIEPGVTVHVAPMVGITVRGVLTALVCSLNNCCNFFFFFLVALLLLKQEKEILFIISKMIEGDAVNTRSIYLSILRTTNTCSHSFFGQLH